MKAVNDKLVTDGADRELCGWLLIAANARQINLKEVLCYELSSVPFSPAYSDGSLRKTTKSALAPLIEAKVHVSTRLANSQEDSVHLINGMALVQVLKPAASATFGDLAANYFKETAAINIAAPCLFDFAGVFTDVKTDFRKQICSINGKQSDVNDLKCGVPQGSTNLGPFLFLLYINDLPRCLQTTKARLFADDTTLSISASTVDELGSKLNHDLLNVNEWLIANKLTLNEAKTEFMIIGSRQRVPSFEQGPIIKLGNQVIKRVPNKKTLGVILNEHLNWNKHIDEQNKKI